MAQTKKQEEEVEKAMQQEPPKKYSKNAYSFTLQGCPEFLGYEISENKECFKLPNKNGWINLDIFYSDWNWVMKIVEAIEDIIFDEDNSFNVTIGSTNYCVIQDSNGEVYETIQDCGNSKLETVIKAINQFLIWYEKSNGTVVQ